MFGFGRGNLLKNAGEVRPNGDAFVGQRLGESHIKVTHKTSGAWTVAVVESRSDVDRGIGISLLTKDKARIEPGPGDGVSLIEYTPPGVAYAQDDQCTRVAL